MATKIGEIGPSHGFGTSPRENAERVPISSISPKGEVPNFGLILRGNRAKESAERVPISLILVAHVLTRWQDIGHQNRGNGGNRDPLMVLALHP